MESVLEEAILAIQATETMLDLGCLVAEMPEAIRLAAPVDSAIKAQIEALRKT